MPGSFLLLLDGLNEVSVIDAQRIVRDLERASSDSRVSAIITLRADGLPGPVRVKDQWNCWALEPLGMRDIRRLAEAQLAPELVAPFILGVRQRIGTKAGASLFTLPFAIAGALASFARTHALPDTLYKVVDDILLQRFERNDEIDVTREAIRIARTTLLALAGEIAFQLHVLQYRHAATAPEVEALIHSARKSLLARSVFGADTLTDRGSLDTLVHHEVLTRSKADGYSFSHEMVAAFLAAHRLVTCWREHVSAIPFLKRPGAWLFVGHLLPIHERPEFLREVAMRDAYIAAEIAVASGLEADAESVLLEMEGHALRNDVDTWVWLCGLAKLGTSACHAKLNTLSMVSSMHEDAVRALAILGDVHVLTQILPRAEKLVSTFIRGSGGELDTWNTAPPKVALELARSRIDSATAETRIGASAQTLARYGDQEDVARLANLITSRDPKSLLGRDSILIAGEALATLDAKRAQEVLVEAASRADLFGKILLLRLLAHVGGMVDVDALLRIVLAEESDPFFVKGPKVDRLHEVEVDRLREIAAQALTMVQLSEPQVQRLRDGLSHLKEGRDHAWTVAAAQRSEVFDELAMSQSAALAYDNEENVEGLCHFALSRKWSAGQRDQFVAGVRVFVRRPETKFTWDLAKALEYLWAQDEHSLVGEVLREHVSMWLRAYKSALSGAPLGLKVGHRRDKATSTMPTTDKTGLELLTRFRTILSEAAQALPPEQRIEFLSFHSIDSAAIDAHSHLFEGLSATLLDDALLAIEQPKERAIALAKIAAWGVTPVRVRVLIECCEALIHYPIYFNQLKRAVILMWSDEVAEGLTVLLRRVNWDDSLASHTENDLMTAGFPFDREQVTRVIEPALTPELHWRSRNVLMLWARKGRRNRRGQL